MIQVARSVDYKKLMGTGGVRLDHLIRWRSKALVRYGFSRPQICALCPRSPKPHTAVSFENARRINSALILQLCARKLDAILYALVGPFGHKSSRFIV